VSAALVLADAAAGEDVATFARRVARFEPDAVVRVVARGSVLGLFALTPFEAVALRAVRLTEPAELDAVVEAGTLAARAAGARAHLELPAALPALRWTGGLPPVTGWTEVARLPADAVAARVAEGVAEFRRRALAAGASGPAARAALESLAADVWSRDLAADVPVRLAHAAESYGFLGDPPRGDVVLRSAAAWRRLDTTFGSVLARTGSGLGLFAL
jgi:hypothetical protein